ncbi:hypothetical protein ACTFQF_14520 [Aliivibrio fischeri]|uniref:hypothetical protein n=1 Tax=Aliivibrio fischeri TaxID=668 RepID=UPI0007C57651|nr:hypothetical protein [Aliivibrio fischeri]MBP3142296.1 hypothetical protein [Aliivibrio fischeri]MBP3157077.1 hypothetical protein [Aliivibrio fischeri]MCE7572630.1 hypothetical protein [Aliivibrio fischeri]
MTNNNSYINKFKQNFYLITRQHLLDKKVKSRFINPNLSQSQVKFRNFLFSRLQMHQNKQGTFFISLNTRKSANCDYPFTNDSAIKSIVKDWNDAYFTLSYAFNNNTQRQAIKVEVNPVYFNDFANANLRVNLTNLNTRSMMIFARELKHKFISSNKENFVYLNDFASEADKFNTTSIKCKKMRHQTFKSACKKALQACTTIDSSSIRWCKTTFRFFYELTEATMLDKAERAAKKVVKTAVNVLDSLAAKATKLTGTASPKSIKEKLSKTFSAIKPKQYAPTQKNPEHDDLDNSKSSSEAQPNQTNDDEFDRFLADFVF